jgi:DNA-binding MarR family transcriptional regulator
MRIFPRKQTHTPSDWTFLSNHAHVLICLYREPEIRLRDVAEAVGITERGVQRIVAELEQEGYLTRERIGRRNRYTVHLGMKLRHPVEQPATLRDLLKITKHA